VKLPLNNASAVVVLVRILLIGAFAFAPFPQAQGQDVDDEEDTEEIEDADEPTDESAAQPEPVESNEVIKEIIVGGNRKVERDAVLTTIKSRPGDRLSKETIKEDIKLLYELGYFSDIQIFKEPFEDGIGLIIEVAEKPAIVEIHFNGLNELSEEDFKDKVETKLYTIVNEHTLNNDLRIIEQQYLMKGFYLATATYKLEKKDGNPNEVILNYNVDEGGKVQVGDVEIIGNKYFTDTQIIDKLLSKPVTRDSAISTPGSMYNEDFVKRDVEVITMMYKDQGFAEAKSAKPITVMDPDREFVRVTFEVEEGIQYNIGSIRITGDMLFEEKELLDLMKLKEGELFRQSFLVKDIDTLFNKYADKGYAFTDVNPVPRFDREKKLAHLTIRITKGEKIYFGEISIVGNTKTRDNVIRRELDIADSELYNQTNLTKSKNNVERLGFFEEVQSIKERDAENPEILHYKFKVKEKPTGQLQAALGFSPSSNGVSESQWFGQGRYSEENQSGRGWKTGLSGKWNGGNNYSLDLEMRDPRVNDSLWSLGFRGYYTNTVVDRANINVQERTVGGQIDVGRTLFELIRANVAYNIEKTTQISDGFLIERLKEDGIESAITLGLSRSNLDNNLDPSEGTIALATQKFAGGLLGGDFQYMESQIGGQYYLPLDFTEEYRTYFHFNANYRMLWPWGGKTIPLSKRYRMGGYDDLRGWEFEDVGPEFSVLNGPGDTARAFAKGGTKRFLLQFEYFVPIIKEANIKGLLFTDLGRVYDDGEAFDLNNLKQDVGFGFRWITPIAPFRFEFAYPLENGKVGDQQFIFSIGF
jgi:outer membrane protein insertion porin family